MLKKENDDVFICSGGMILPKKTKDGQFVVQYKMIGTPPNVAVPTHFYKVIVVTRNDGAVIDVDRDGRATPASDAKRRVAMAAFVMPNSAIAQDAPLTAFLVEPDVVYKSIGTRLFPQLDRERHNVRHLCDVADCSLPPPNWWLKDALPKKQLTAGSSK
jgi:endonuclease G